MLSVTLATNDAGMERKQINGGKTNQRMTCVKGRCASQNKEKSEKKDELEDGGVREGRE